jgi:chemotaxis protein CheX
MNAFGTTLVSPFAGAAVRVLRTELGVEASAQAQRVESAPIRGSEVLVLVGVTGDVRGQFVLSMSAQTAMGVVGVMMGESVSELDEMGQSAVAELGNMIAGLATVELEQLGVQANITPPSLVTGRGAELSVRGACLVAVPLTTSLGEIMVHVALSEGEVTA